MSFILPPPVFPMTSLPDDLLYEIFLRVGNYILIPLNAEEVIIYDRERDSKVPFWANSMLVSQVCRRWREIALSSPHLWTFLMVTGSPSNKAMIEEFIRRSGKMPLTALFAPHEIICVGAIHAIAATERLEHLVATLDANGINALFFALQDMSAFRDTLKTLRLSCLGQSRQGRLSDIFTAQSPFPALRAFHASYMPITALPSGGLVRLELVHCVRGPDLQTMLSTLRNSPNLEFLHLVLADVLKCSPRPNEEVRPVELAKLQSLTLKTAAFLDDFLPILPYIIFPLTTAVNVFCAMHYLTSPWQMATPIRPPPCSASLNAFTSAIRRASAVLVDRDRMCLWSHDLPLNITMYFPNKTFERCQNPLNQEPLRLSEIFTTFHVLAITSLSFATEEMCRQVDTPLSPKQFRYLLDSLPHLTELEIHTSPCHASSIAAALMPSFRPDHRAASFRCPKLRSLLIHWKDERPRGGERRAIQRCCIMRGEAGAPLILLRLVPSPCAKHRHGPPRGKRLVRLLPKGRTATS